MIHRNAMLRRILPLLVGTLLATSAWSAPAPTPRKANHDEAKVPPFTLPDPLRFQDGRPVNTAEQWLHGRRAELLQLFEQHVYGRFPPAPENPRWRVISEEPRAVDGTATRRDVVLELPEPDATRRPSVALRVTVFHPNAAPGPVPVFVGIHLFDTSRPNPAPAAPQDPAPTGTPATVGTAVGREILQRGYALASIDIEELAPDTPDRYTQGALRLLGLAKPGTKDPEKPGALGAWAWGLSRALDYFSTDSAFDASAVLAIGHSRMGKAALWAGANDPRFAAVIANGSGCGGAALSKRDFGETVAIITHAFPHWFGPAFASYANRESELPVDQHELIALLAPRPVYLAAAAQDLWADPHGEFLAARHASPVFRLLGVAGLPAEPSPTLDQPIGSTLRYHLRHGRHDLTDYDWSRFLAFAEDEVRNPTIARRLAAARRLDAGAALRQPDTWFASPSAARLASHILSHQSIAGSWPKNTNTATAPFQGPPRQRGTFDNGATVGELRFLARFQRVSDSPPAREAVQRGIRHILEAQYPTGGWPQSHPPGSGYERHITFNDDTQLHLMEVLHTLTASPDFAFLDPALRDRCRTAFERGIECILRCQVRVANTPTVWCAQHDAVTLEPRPARAFEPASLSGAESAAILRFLMRLESPSPAVVKAIRAGVTWFATSALHGIRIDRSDNDVRVVPQADAPPLWARFYDLETQQPLFTGRDAVVRRTLAEIEHERRTGYAWYGTWGSGVARDFERWSRSHP